MRGKLPHESERRDSYFGTEFDDKAQIRVQLPDPGRKSFFMKYIFSFLFLLLLTAVQAQTVQDKYYSTTGYIKEDGTVQDKYYSTVGYIKSDGTVQDKSYSTLGYIKSDGTVQDKYYSTLGYIKDDGTVQDKYYSTRGYVKSDGTVQDKYYSTIGYGKGIPVKQLGAYFFFFDFR